LAKLEVETAKMAALTNVYRLRYAGSVKLRETRREAAPVLDSLIRSTTSPGTPAFEWDQRWGFFV
jgi:hypothetical protein